jgi:pantetheine-phosphate adenylyltransferase
MKKTAVFPGSFDPITKGHLDLILRAAKLFDTLFVAIGVHAEKQTMFSLENRLKFLQAACQTYPNIQIHSYQGLTVDFCKLLNATYLVRGIRNEADFRYEYDIAQINKMLNSNVETVFLLSAPQYAHISSSTVREIIRNHGDYQQFIPENIKF